MKSLLVKLFGFPATLVHGDTLVLDRWLWIKRRLPVGLAQPLIDVGCGTGAFTIGAAKRGYGALGLSWDERNQAVGRERAALCRAPTARFEILDVRMLDTRTDLRDCFDIALCCEVIEHIIDDEKLLRDIAGTLKPGGRLLLTTPNSDYKAITKEDNGPFCEVETGWHVRKGYSESRLRALAAQAGLEFDECSYCSGLLSQKITFLWRKLARIHPVAAFGLTLPLRVLPPLLDPLISRVLSWPLFSICMIAHKPNV